MDRPVSVVTGANRGIGRGLVEALAARGHHVVVTARDGAQADGIAAQLRDAGHAAVGHALDVRSDASVEALGRFVRERLGRWDVLINNAAILPDRGGLFDSTAGDAIAAFDTNTLGAWRMARVALPVMRAQGSGRVVQVSSGMGGVTEMGAGYPAYRWSKAALNALTRMLAAEAGPVRVNSVCPGWVRTDMGGPSAPRSVAEGVASVLWAVDLPDDGPTGGFFRDGLPVAF
jgi:NAD(P)-dependent dehydrogenase (short-subunit alcohol dehydrogenase family)